MNRTIKFRVYSPDHKKYLESYSWPNGHDGLYLNCDNGKLSIQENEEDDKEQYYTDLIIEQFTGQLDLDEKEVFEGDKVSAYSGNIFNVVFYKSAFQLEQSKTKVIVPFSTFDGNFEIIGTIHDTKDETK